MLSELLAAADVFLQHASTVLLLTGASALERCMCSYDLQHNRAYALVMHTRMLACSDFEFGADL